MSGIEVAGLVLGGIPLIISGEYPCLCVFGLAGDPDLCTMEKQPYQRQCCQGWQSGNLKQHWEMHSVTRNLARSSSLTL